MTDQPCKTHRQDIYRKGDRVFFFDHYEYLNPADKMKFATVMRDQCGSDLSIMVDGEENFGKQWGLEGGRFVKLRDIYDIYNDSEFSIENRSESTTNTTVKPEINKMNATQIATLNAIRTADRRTQIAALKALRAEGVEVLPKLTASAIAIAAEVSRLLAVAAAAVKSAISKAATDIKASLAYWQCRPVKPLNRGERGAIALSIKLGF